MEAAIKKMSLRFNDVILDPILYFLVMASVLFFFWGLAQFLMNDDVNNKDSGKQHMLWGVIGLFIVFSAWGFINLVQSTLTSVSSLS